MNRKSLLHLLAYSLLTFLFATSSAEAQPTREANSQGYLFVAPGGVRRGDGTLHLGGGAEGILTNGGSVGAELGYLTPLESLKDGLGVFSLNGGYHFKSASRSGKAVPFLTAGYAGFFRRGYANGFTYGGGVNYWFKERVGLRLEFRDHVFIESGSTHFLNARIGFVFR